MKEEKISPVEYLAERYSYVNWLRNRDEISEAMAEEWRKHYLDVAKWMEAKDARVLGEHCV